jgi:D-3-phosphoglycerate dehydrogenase / 2-oxoglutarate reductase
MQKDNSTHTYIIDFDSTLVSVESLGLLAEITLKNDPQKEQKRAYIADLTERCMNGEIGFADSLTKRLNLLSLNQRHLDVAHELLEQHITPSAIRCKHWFRAHADTLYVISGGFKELIIPIANMLGIKKNHVYANTFLIDKHGIVHGCDPKNLLAREGGKERQARALNLSGDITIIGDGITDYQMKGAYPQARFLYFAEHVQRKPVMKVADGILDSFDVLCELET